MKCKEFRRSRMLTGAGLLAILSVSIVGCSGGNRDDEKWASRKDIHYVPGSVSPSQSLDIWFPSHKDSANVPLIVFIHGGAWVEGDKKQAPNTLFNRAGYACASINYRFSDQAKFPAQIFDCKAAIRWLRAHAGEFHVDPNKIGVWGISAGGHLVSLLGTSGGVPELEGDEGNLETNSAVQAVCDWCGPTNLATIDTQARPNEEIHAEDPDGVIARLLGGTPKQKPELTKMANPCTYITADDPPFLIMHGDVDSVVPVGQSRELYKALQDGHVPSQLIEIKDQNHNFLSQEAVRLMIEFFDKQLKK